MKHFLRVAAVLGCSWLFLNYGPSTTQSVQAQANAPAVQRDVVYGEAGGEKQLLDVFGADPTQKRPALIFLHGGGWISGSKNDVAAMAQGSTQLGYVGFSVGYRLVKDNKNRFPAQIDDVQRAVRWIRAHSAEYGVNPDKIGVMGFSAGGHLAALLGTTDTRDNSDQALAGYSSRVQCVVDVYGPTDFTRPLEVDPQIVAAQANTAGAQLVLNFLGPLPEAKDNYIAASPIKHIDKKTVPFLIFHGAKDTLVPVDQSTTFDAALREEGIETKLVVFPNAGHAYSEPALMNETFAQTIAFFNRHLKG